MTQFVREITMPRHNTSHNASGGRQAPLVGSLDLRAPEIHDFSDFRIGGGRAGRALAGAIAIATLLVVIYGASPSVKPATDELFAAYAGSSW
jgi:hypothetical protein